ncbi:hypothetical protein BJV74DRAFT_795015 [Russula compacta]|nr:hypothetical protein BJV74DRAFT_795015 [Russula compacta]
MTAQCSFHSTSVVHVFVPSVVGQEHQIGLRPAPMHITKYESPRNPSSVERGLIMDSLPHLCPTEHPIEHSPASACPSGNYIASPLPFLEDATANAMPLPPLPPSPSSSSSPSSHDHLIPRAFHSIERRRRSRRSSHGGADYHYFSNMTRVERAAVKTAASRRVAFAEHAHQIPSSSLWTAPDGARPVATATASGKSKRRAPTPTPIPAGRTMGLSLGLAGTSFDSGERESSPGFDADVEFECVEVARRSRRAHVGPKERLTIIVPGGKSEAYVAMAFERSCSLADDDHDDDDDAGAVQDRMPSSPSSSVIPPQPTMGLLVAPEADEGICNEETNGKTGLKIKIPVPNPLFMLSLRLANSCRVEDEAEARAHNRYLGSCTGGSLEESAYSPTSTSTSSGGPGSGSVSQDQGQVSDPVPVFPVPVRPLLRVGGTHPRSLSRSPTPPVAPPPTPAPEGRVARRIVRRAALAPYSAVDRPSLHAARSSKRPYLLPYC